MTIKEYQILFNTPMVRAILTGQKTVTRRVMKFQPGADAVVTVGRYHPTIIDRHGNAQPGPEVFGAWWQDGECSCKSPYGQPGDKLWVRESLGYDCEYGHYFAAGGAHGETVFLCSLFDDEETQTGYSYDGLLPERSVPSIHLHRRYSRILLEVTAVRVERLQDISRSDIRAEGLQCPPELASDDISPNYRDWFPAAFRELWNSTGGDWAANPWVWVIEFKQVTP
ncbi:hypothetical protein KTQ74_26060 [Pseudomonas chlororaphis]|uniref:hypothetical protein n=1 Tax=Pseudomonas chlororaphis TaxID=587753 RepID=UPI001E5F61EE|nr:hypothetical protein [Pseudomonas chlororaphis]MCB2255391.1 hypothetical protein [Pseudomonas chlororaphis]